MILTGHQPNYLPYPGFFEKIARADVFLIVDTTQFVKRGPFGWIHRNKIRDATGWQWLTVPVVTHDRFTQAIRDVEIDNRLPWRRKHWRTLQVQYARAPYFKDHAPWFEDLYRREWTHLAPLAEEAIRYVIRALGIEVRIERLSDLGVEGRSTDLVAAFTKRLGAETYLSGIHGKDYLDRARFEAEGIELVFQEWSCPAYPQVHGGDFVPNLSVVDLLFNCGPASLDLILGRAQTKGG